MSLRGEEVRLTGIPASPGIGVGPAFLYGGDRHPGAAETIRVEERDAEWARFTAAVEAADRELSAMAAAMRSAAGAEEAEVFEAHRLILQDPALTAGVEEAIRAGRLSAASAVERACDELAGVFRAMEDERFRAREADVRDVGRLLVRILRGEAAPRARPAAPSVIVAEELLPSDTARLDRHAIVGFATDRGGPTSHVAILARALRIPAVTGLGDVTRRVRTGELCIVDGDSGAVVVRPSPEAVGAYAAKKAASPARPAADPLGPGTTADGHPVPLLANVGGLEEIQAALSAGAEGIGLLRTEFLFVDREALPGEEEQYEVYRAVTAQMDGRPVVIRAADLGGDKPPPGLRLPREVNPFLGLRGIRLLLRHPGLLRTQAQAVLRASAHGPVKLMLPMIATVEEAREALGHVVAVRRELEARGVRPGSGFAVGAMIETPAAALIADALAEIVEFFSVGTNDLVQYTLAADRTHGELADLYQPTHPAVLRLIAQTSGAARRRGRVVAVCGEMAGDSTLAPLLVGLGVDELSMAPASLPAVRAAIRGHTLAGLRELAERATACGSAAEVTVLCRAAAARGDGAAATN